jgi:phosphate transport system substrate-binding protein
MARLAAAGPENDERRDTVSNRLLALATGLVAAVGFTVSVQAQQVSITGAGASFPNPLYQKWGEGARQGAGIQLNYQSVGSGAGQAQIRNRTVDFGASDAPMTAEQLSEANLLQFPSTMGSIVAIVNIPGVADDKLRLTGELISDIYLGKITKWNDPRIVEMNSDVALPNLTIAPVYRADGSGTTFVWVSYLSAVSDAFKKTVGIGTSVRWPAGTGARGNEGVAGTVRNVRGAIGYVEYAYAHSNNLVATQLRNKAGNFVTPSTESFQAAAANADWSVPGFAASLVDTHGAASWPIVTPTFILLPKNPDDAARAQGVMRFFDWAYRDGDATASSLDYIPLPPAVEDAVRAAWTAQVRVGGKPVWPAN